MEQIYYSPRGYFMGKSAIGKLASAAKVSRIVATEWLSRQAIWQIYQPGPKSITRGSFDVYVPNEVHQADILYLPHDRQRRVYKYALTVIDVASRYKEAYPLSTKSSNEVANAFTKIYQKGPLRWPNLLQVDPGSEFRGKVSSVMAKHNVAIRRGHTTIHHDQGIVERFNKTLADKLFYYQTAKEFIQPERSREWVARLPKVISSLNDQIVTSINDKPANAITKKYISVKSKGFVYNDAPLRWNATVRYLYEPGELEGGAKRSTDPIWSTTTHKIYSMVSAVHRPTYYKLDPTAPQRSFTQEQLQVIPDDTQLPPSRLQ